MSTSLHVRATGPLCLVEDLGRPGASGIGVGRSGAADRFALRQANRALANPEDVAALEVTFGGLELEVRGGQAWFCVTGAPAPPSVDGRDVATHTVVPAGPGSLIRLGTPAHGLRSYVAFRGGIDVAPVLGSRSRDVMAGIGPAPLEPGHELALGSAPTAYPGVDALPPRRLDDDVELTVVRGPRDGWVRDVEMLVRTSWTASEHSNRVGMRLQGGIVEHRDRGEGARLPSEGAYRGAIQVPPSGEPVVFLADHPVTGGYPVVAVVVDADVDRAAQVRPGQLLRFRWRASR